MSVVQSERKFSPCSRNPGMVLPAGERAVVLVDYLGGYACEGGSAMSPV